MFGFGWNSRGAMYSKCCLLSQTERCFGKKPCCSFLVFSGAYFRALVRLIVEKVEDKWRGVFSSRGCLGCFTKPTLIIAVDEPSKGLKIQGRAVRKSSVSEDIWSSSTLDMDNSALQSQRSISLISTSNQALDPQSTSTSTLNPPEFVNHVGTLHMRVYLEPASIFLNPSLLLRWLTFSSMFGIRRVCMIEQPKPRKL
ncbi:uncharacterized protein LOC107409467 isoform X2 [Ziziphus jujuba]|uniref:Uncharacterized protein LOC107409467 isoform X2 n=1 Tax=Ziziphus jujuba TaxID=326968 RepID=A0ABM3IND9_ZIZJJ|nr:uncharacterized protein LOC107409467 isoform X2 [Ziziphus jujuba]